MKTEPVEVWILDDGTELADEAALWLEQSGTDVTRIKEWNANLICEQLEIDFNLSGDTSSNLMVKRRVLLFVEGAGSLSCQWKQVITEISSLYTARMSTRLTCRQLLICMLFVPHQPEPESYTFLLLGGDDVIQFPCSRMEWECRLQRTQLNVLTQDDDSTNIYQIGDLIINPQSRTVRRGTTELQLTAREYELLVILAQHHSRPVSRKFLMAHVWSIDFDTTTNIVDVYIRYLRRKIDKGRNPKLIHTVRGYGYQLKDPTR
ncbi:winged helix-turn-helix domain-containing protein [Paenibacillus sp. ACRRX]|uniref:winged helix-turn-helix domain-containing protein n=1 Tax=Paenibacillus sp. ACRRX TaxID=2918206 RepID=UPI001EF7475A|nr:winged helix-turn-helix domain-containing protein [Paenibacillus sp. ACRRX]MCG7407146.1 winged helix-turn-helix domain-containing protein [Paenibacillus sp. ACRRX]